MMPRPRPPVYNAIQKQIKLLTSHGSYQPVLLKLQGGKEEISLAKEIEKCVEDSRNVLEVK